MATAKSAEKIVWLRQSDMPKIEMLSVNNGRRLWGSYHQTNTVCTIADHQGLTEWGYRRRQHPLYNRPLMLMESGEIHRNTRPTVSADFYIVQIACALVENLARAAGFFDYSHLIRHFKKVMGVMPGQYAVAAGRTLVPRFAPQ